MNFNLLNAINWTTFGLVLGIVAVLAIVFAVLIVLVSKLCAVEEDERIEAVSEKLAGANCGGCGFAGCSDYAKALVEGKADLTACGATSSENKAEIAKILDIPYSAEEQTFAVIKCAAGLDGTLKYEYVGNEGCANQSVYMGGQKKCSEGCVGDGTCMKVCPQGAITAKNGAYTVDKALCNSCGVCARNCPKKIIDYVPSSAKVYVACSTACKGKEAMGNCKVSCIGCGLCAKNCPENAITMVNNLPVIDYSKCSGCLTCVTKCPRKSIKTL